MFAAIAWKAIAISFAAFIGLLLFVSPAFAEAINDSAPAIEWQYIYGGPGSDVGYNAVQTSDGGYLVVGVTRSYGNGSYDTWLLKLDAQGHAVWNRTYGGSGGDWLYGIAPLADGNFVMAGATNSWGSGGFDVWLVKVNGNGDVIWSRTYGSSYADAGFAVAPLANGRCVVTGYWGSSNGESDFAIISVDADGNPAWNRKYHNGVQDWCKAIIATSDGGYAVSGWTQASSGSKAQAYLLKVDANGEKQWGHAYGGSSGDSYGYGLVETGDGGIILSGHTSAKGAGGMDVYAVKVDAAGSTLWERAYGQSRDDYGFNVLPLADGNTLGGYTNSFDPSLWKLYFLKIGKDGSLLTAETYGPKNTSVKGGLALHTADGGFLFVGNTNEYGSGKDDVYVVKLSGTPLLPVPPAEDIVAKAALPVAAVAAGTGLCFLALFMGRIFDYLSEFADKTITAVGRIGIVDTLYNLVYGYFKTYIKGMIFGRINKIKVAVAGERTPFLAGLSSTELLVVLISAVLLGIAYIFAKKLNIVQFDTLVLYVVIAGLVTSLHDLTHRYFAHKYKAVAEYKFWWFGTAVMFLTALGLGVTYAVPARTIINKAGDMNVKEQAIVFLSGPLVSGLLAFAFLLLVPFGGVLRTIGLLGVSMNLLSAVYSLTPFQPMDGNKVYRWKKALWVVTFVPFLVLYLWITIFVQ